MNVEDEMLMCCTETSDIVVTKYLSLAFMVTLSTFKVWTLRYFVYLETFQVSATE
jgi:hypothetical protein